MLVRLKQHKKKELLWGGLIVKKKMKKACKRLFEEVIKRKVFAKNHKFNLKFDKEDLNI